MTRPEPDRLRRASWLEVHGGDLVVGALAVILVVGTIVGALLA